MMLSGYQSTGLGCGLTPCNNCGLGDLIDPSTWGPADWLVAAGAAWIGWKLYQGQEKKRYTRKVIRRLTGA